ncbi:MAG: small multi-drug export protein [Candidatus Methanomethyliaceae archaeon]|nr:small multi-drug export protein [Candidatus Methanomethyliaceae archaeon]
MSSAETLLNIFLIALSPVLESRVAIPYGISSGVELPIVLLISFLGNMVPVPFLLLTMQSIERWMTRREDDSYLKRLFVRYINNLRKRGASTINKYGFIGLTIFVALPVPGTGAWTGSVLAYLFGIELKRSTFAILIGVLISIFIITIAAIWFSYFL